MGHIILLTLFILFISTGSGIFFENKTGFSLGHFHAPIGFVTYLACLQLTYYPLQLLGLSSVWLMAVSSILTILFFFYSLLHIRNIILEYWNLKSLWIIASLFLFVYVFYHCSVALDSSDSTQYLNLICQNIDVEHLGRFSFNNGELGAQPDVFYLFQGYYYFGSFLCWLINVPYTIFHISGFTENIATIVWVLGTLYSVISTMLMVNIVSYFESKLGNLASVLLTFLLFYYNFYYWRVAYAFYGNTWRTLLVGLLLWMLYQKYQEQKNIPYIAFFVVMVAGLASSSSYMFISIDILYLLMAYLFFNKTPRAFGIVFKFAFPIVLYVFAFISQYSTLLTILFTILCTTIYILIFFSKPTFQNKVDIWMNHYGKIILLVLIPLFFVAFSIYTWISNPYYLITFSHYFDNYAKYDMILDPFGVYSNPFERILICVKWFGYFLAVRSGWKNRTWLSFTLFFTMLIFLNPLTITAISRIYTMNVYYRVFDIILNPFTIVIYIVCIRALLSNHEKSLRISSVILTCFALVLMHLNLISNIETYTSYNYQLKDGKEVDPILKVKKEAYEVFSYIRETGLVPSDHQITVLSHAEGFKTFFPNVYMLYTKNQMFYTEGRRSEEFYQMAKRHFGWEEKPDVQYENGCKYVKEFNVELAVINVYESPELDEALNSCMTTELRTKNYTIKTLD